MKRFMPLSLVFVVLAVGCEATNSRPASSQPSNQSQMANWNNEIEVHIRSDGQVFVNYWRIEDKNLADMVRDHQVGKAKILGDSGTDYKRALEVKKELEAAGVKNVEIVMPKGG